MTRRQLRRSALLLALSAASVASAASDIGQRTVQIPLAGGGSVGAQLFRVDTATHRVAVLSARALKDDSVRDGRGTTLRWASNHPQVSRVILTGALLVNGGFSGTPSERPDGLLVAGGQVLSTPNFTELPAEPANACPLLRTRRYKLAGALCIGRDRMTSIQPIATLDVAQCAEALQSGPLLVDGPGRPAICEQEPASAAAPRTALCLTGPQLTVVVSAGPIRLYDLARWLARPVAEGGLGCDSALNLAGDQASGALYFPGGAASFGRRVQLGNASFPLASMLLIHRWKL